MNEFPWLTALLGFLTIVGSGIVGLVTSRWTQRNQSKLNDITGTDMAFGRQNKVLNEVQEERDHAIKERDAAREDAKAERALRDEAIANLRSEFESFKQSVRGEVSRYRAYIHKLRGQIYNMGGTPIDWPQDVEQ